MAPLPYVANVVRSVITCYGNDTRKTDNVIHWSYTGAAPSSANCVSLATSLWGSWINYLSAYQHENVALTEIEITDLSSGTAGQGIYNADGTPYAGALTGDPLPLSTCMLVNKYIARIYRGGHPRSYLPVGDVTKIDTDGEYNSVFASDVHTAYNSMVTGFVGVEAGTTTISAEVCVSYIDKTLNPTPPYRRTTPAVFPVLTTSTQQQFATQRRRVRRTARHR